MSAPAKAIAPVTRMLPAKPWNALTAALLRARAVAAHGVSDLRSPGAPGTARR